MKRLLISAAAVSSLALGGCATDQAAMNHTLAATAAGAALGAGAGAIAGSVIPGIGTGAGAAIGFGVGGLIGSVVGVGTYNRDTHGYCYYIDQYGHTHYDYRVRC
jgi:hypothetical protein